MGRRVVGRRGRVCWRQILGPLCLPAGLAGRRLGDEGWWEGRGGRKGGPGGGKVGLVGGEKVGGGRGEVCGAGVWVGGRSGGCRGDVMDAGAGECHERSVVSLALSPSFPLSRGVYRVPRASCLCRAYAWPSGPTCFTYITTFDYISVITFAQHPSVRYQGDTLRCQGDTRVNLRYQPSKSDGDAGPNRLSGGCTGNNHNPLSLTAQGLLPAVQPSAHSTTQPLLNRHAQSRARP